MIFVVIGKLVTDDICCYRQARRKLKTRCEVTGKWDIEDFAFIDFCIDLKCQAPKFPLPKYFKSKNSRNF